MPETRLRQIMYESEHWKYALHLMEELNIHHKNSLSRLLKSNLNKTNLAVIESFHISFLTADHVISVLRNDISALEHMLATESPESDRIHDLIRRIREIRITMTKAEEQFNKQRQDFTRYLSENIFYS